MLVARTRFDSPAGGRSDRTRPHVSRCSRACRCPPCIGGRHRRGVPRVARRPLVVDDEAARQRLERRIAAHLVPGRVALAVTDNRYTMISVKREKGPLYRVRLHHMFLDADSPMVRSLASYI